ncbi:hypothetical protein BHM03_00040619, partial [Ensete ventricosum]
FVVCLADSYSRNLMFVAFAPGNHAIRSVVFNCRWDRFKHQMQEIFRHSDLKGVGLRKRDASLYSFPMPDCMCQQAEA